MSDPITIDYIVRELTGSSGQKGDYGEVRHLPCDCAGGDVSHARKERCPECEGNMYTFNHQFDVLNKEPKYSYKDMDFAFTEETNITVEGEYCPICNHTKVNVAGFLYEDESGDL